MMFKNHENWSLTLMTVGGQISLGIRLKYHESWMQTLPNIIVLLSPLQNPPKNIGVRNGLRNIKFIHILWISGLFYMEKNI